MKNVMAFGLLWLGLIVQSTLFQIPPINVIQPNLVLVVLVIISLTRGPRPALILGVLIGFIQDLNYGTFLGLYAFTDGMIGYFCAAAFAQFLHKNVAITFFISVISTFVFVWVTFGMTRMFDVTAFSWRMVMSRSITQMIVNGVALLVLYPPLTKWLRPAAKRRYKSEEEAI